MKLEGKVALVTGAGSGIGRAIALACAHAGARVVVSDVDAGRGQSVVDEIGAAGGEGHFVAADATKADDHEALVRATVDRFGALHAACNNAGISGTIMPLTEYPLDDWDRVIGINLSGVFYGMRAQIPAMIAAGGGSIVNIASILGAVGSPGSCAYVASKHGVVGLTRTGALDYATQNIRVNAVGPGYIRTPLIEKFGEDMLSAVQAKHPVQRLGRPEEVAAIVVWLLSDRASFVTGAYYPVDGGYLAQ